MPKTHLLTDSDDVEGVASSGFLRMFAQDMAGSGGLPPAWLTTQLDEVQEKSRSFVDAMTQCQAGELFWFHRAHRGPHSRLVTDFLKKDPEGLFSVRQLFQTTMRSIRFTKMKWVCPVRTPRLSDRFLRCPCKLHLQCQKWCLQWRRSLSAQPFAMRCLVWTRWMWATSSDAGHP